MGLSKYLLRLLESWFYDREFEVYHAGAVSEVRTLQVGIPQGGVLSPLVWLVFLSDLYVEVEAGFERR